jgi:hypothetical protein
MGWQASTGELVLLVKKLDLHHTRHHLVRNKLIRFIEEHWDTNTEAHIITGRSDEMQNIVKEVLDEYKLEYSIGDFSGLNTGYIKTEI